MLIHNYDLKAIVEDLIKYINLGGMTVSINVADDFYFKKSGLDTPYHINCKTDHLIIYINGQDPSNMHPLTEEFTGWFYCLIKCMYMGMLRPFLDDSTYHIDRLTKGMLKLLPSDYLNNFEIGD